MTNYEIYKYNNWWYTPDEVIKIKILSNKTKIIGFFILTAISVIIIIIDLLEEIKTPGFYPIFVAIVAILGVILAFIQYLGNHSTYLFFKINKIYRMWKVNTVSWESTYKFYANNIKTINDFKELKKEYINWLEKEEHFNIEKKDIDNDDILKLSIKYKGRERNIRLTYFQGDQPFIKYNFSSSLAYKDSLEEFSVFEFFLEKLEKSITNDREINRKNQYKVEISLEKWNPFYKIILTQFENKHIKSYELIINDVDSEKNKGKIIVKPKSIIINSESKNFMKEAVEDYLIFSSAD